MTQIKGGRQAQSLYHRQAISAMALLFPIMLFFVAVVYYPIVHALVMSFFEWDLFKTANPFVGLANYRKMFEDSTFLHSLLNTTVYTFFTVASGTLLALLLATLLNRDLRLGNLYRFLYYIPVITPLVASAVIWTWLYHPSHGLINYALSFLGIANIGWLVDPRSAMPAVIIMSVWQRLGFNMLIFLAGLKSIPTVYYDAARVDGASGWQCFRCITIPQLKPVTLFVVVTYTIQAFKVFGQVYVMTAGGPVDATRVVVFDIYQTAFLSMKLSYASAMAFLLLAILLLLTFVQMRLGREKSEPSRKRIKERKGWQR